MKDGIENIGSKKKSVPTMTQFVTLSSPSATTSSISTSTLVTSTVTTTKATSSSLTTTTINNALFRVIESPSSKMVPSSSGSPSMNINIKKNASNHSDLDLSSVNISNSSNFAQLSSPIYKATKEFDTILHKDTFKSDQNYIKNQERDNKEINSKHAESLFVVTCEVDDELEQASTIIEISNDKDEQFGRILKKEYISENNVSVQKNKRCQNFHNSDPEDNAKTKKIKNKHEMQAGLSSAFINPEKLEYFERKELGMDNKKDESKTLENFDILKGKRMGTMQCKLKRNSHKNISQFKKKNVDENEENEEIDNANEIGACSKTVFKSKNVKSNYLDDIFETSNFVNIKDEPSDFVDDEFKIIKKYDRPLKRKCRKFKIKRENDNGIQCQICNLKFRDSYNLHRHTQRRHTDNKNKKKRKIYKCDSCKNSFRDNYDLDRHKKCCVNGRKKAECIYPGCELQFFHMVSMIKHLQAEHNTDINTTDLVFDNYDSFLAWKEVEQDSNLIYFTKRHGAIMNKGTKYVSYICQVDGPLVHETEPRLTSRRWSKGQVRKGIKCPARMLVKECENTGKVTVKYITTHNHAIVPDASNILIKDKLKKGENGDELYHDTSPRQALEELQKEEYNAILVYKPQGQPVEVGDTRLDHLNHSSDLFALGWQTEDMKNRMLEGASKIICVDSTHKTNQYGFQLLNLIVPDSFGSGQPIAHYITNHLDQETLEILFNDLKERCPDVKIDIVMTDDDIAAYNALNAVFGSGIVHLLCHTHTKRLWMRKIKLLVPDDQLKVEIYSSLEELIYVDSENAFESMKMFFIERYNPLCPKFVSYFTKSYLHCPELWAMCHRKYYTVYTDTSLYVEAFHNQLKNFNRKRKPNKTVDDLVLLLLDLDKLYNNEYQKRKEEGWLNADSSAIARHLSGLQISDNDVCQVTALDSLSEGIWKVESQIRKSTSYEVMANISSCALQQYRNCREMCTQESCTTLCSHQYTCTCEERSGLCKHIHKVHSMTLSQNLGQHSLATTVVVENELPNNWELIFTAEEMQGELTFKLQEEPIEEINENNMEQKVQECRSMLLATMGHLDNPLLQQLSLDHIHSTMQKLTAKLHTYDDYVEGS
ncbi:unnamed protein product [Meganyctiphanes norvegica]|uniref:C2H2-type domain-containing protein n=1 Tax=Meganyctiphanes norvegica TaxID=48144 RepID=A0AAV2RT41_MEGNR